MAKKKAAGQINMAEEIRNLLKENGKLSGKEVVSALKKKFPKQKINKASCGVAFSTARKQLGLSKGRPKKRKGGAKKVMRKKPAAVSVDLAALGVAAQFVSKAGSEEQALAAIRQLRALQVGRG